MTDDTNNVVDLRQSRIDRVNQVAFDFFQSSGDGRDFDALEMLDFGLELTSLSLALLTRPDPGVFERHVEMTLEHIDEGARWLRAKLKPIIQVEVR